MLSTVIFKTLALAQIVGYIKFCETITPYIWPTLGRIIKEFNFEFLDVGPIIFIVIWHAICFSVCNLFYYPFYSRNIPYFEQFKVSNEPWPWVIDEKKWRVTFRNSIKRVAFNGLVNLPLFLITTFTLFNKGRNKTRLDNETYGDFWEIAW